MATKKRLKKIKRPKGHIPEYYWPPDVKRPTHWLRMPAPVPCERCDRKLTDHASQAVTCKGGIKGGVAYLECRVCGHRFKMPVASG